MVEEADFAAVVELSWLVLRVDIYQIFSGVSEWAQRSGGIQSILTNVPSPLAW